MKENDTESLTKAMEAMHTIPPRYEDGKKGEHEETLADVIQRAWEEGRRKDPEGTKETIEEYLEFLPPEDRASFLKEKLQEQESGGII